MRPTRASFGTFTGWRVRLDAGRAVPTPAVANGRLLVGGGFGSHDFYAFHAATGVELSMVAADTTDARMLVLNHRTAPGCPLVWAVRMSMSIPLFWDEVVWQEAWGPYLGAR